MSHNQTPTPPIETAYANGRTRPPTRQSDSGERERRFRVRMIERMRIRQLTEEIQWKAGLGAKN